MIRQDVVITFVRHASNIVTELQEHFEHAHLRIGRMNALPLNDHVVVEVLYERLLPSGETKHIGLLVNLLKKSHLVTCLLCGLSDEVLTNAIVDIEQIVGVFASVFQHLGWQRSLSPVCQLVLLVGNDVAVLLQEECKTESWQLQDTRRLTCIEHVHKVKREVSLQPNNIRVGAMQNFKFLRIGEDGPQMVTKLSPQSDRVDDKVLGP